MKICLLGATGRTGKYILQHALEQDHIVTVVVRDARKIRIASKNLIIIEGNASDRTVLEKAMHDCKAVVSALNISRTSDFPWSRLRTPEHFLSDVMKTVIDVCAQYNIQRVIITSAWGVADTWAEIPGWFRWLVAHSNIRYAYEDHALQENLLIESPLEWTILRPVVLTNSKRLKKAGVSFQNTPRPGLTISRNNLAAFIIKILEDHQYFRQKPVVYS